MAKEYKNAGLTCIIITIIAGLGILAGIFFSKPLIIALAMLPAVVYEVYRTEGFFTKIASLLSLVVLLAEGYVIITGFTVDLANINFSFLKNLPVPAGHIQAGLIGPIILVLISLFLLRRTGGKYTRWISFIILISSVALFYTIDPAFITALLNKGNVENSIKKGIQKINR